MTGIIPFEVQALAAECAAVNYRAGVERHEALAEQRRWNPDLLPAERRLADELAEVAITMRKLACIATGKPMPSPTTTEGNAP